MNIENPASKTTKKPKTINKVIQDHFETIDKGTFNVASFNAGLKVSVLLLYPKILDLQAVPTEDVDSRKCVKTLMKLTKDNITGDANAKIVTKYCFSSENNNEYISVEKMTDILIEKYSIKKPNLCEAHFFPSVDSEAKIIEYLKAAKKSIYTCMFTITNEHLCSALLDAHLRGLDVKLLTDDEQFRLMGNYVKDLSEEGVPVRTDATTQALMHNKFTVIDQKILITGSYNWTVRATKANLENIVILDNQDLVAVYAKEFNKLWADYSAHTIANMHGKNKLKTKLYQKYQEGLAKLAKQKLKHDLKKSKEEDEKVKGVIPQSKKISKLPKATEPKNTKKGKKATPDEDHEDENKTVGVNLDMSGLLKLIYLFLIVALTGHWVRHAAVSSAGSSYL